MRVLDLHVDSIIQQRLFGYDVLRKHKAKLKGQPLFWHADVPRMIEAGYYGACLGIHYWPWESEGGWIECNKQIDYLDNVVARDERVWRIRSPADWARAMAAGKLALAPGVEGAHMLAGKLERVEELGRRNVAYMTLTHFSKNSAATPAMGRGANEVDGLTEFGVELVAALEENGVLVDLAHVNTPGVLHACSVATKPLLCTHTGVKAVHDHARNISDEEIDAIAELDGVIGLIFAPTFLAGSLRATTERVADHLEHIADRVGSRHVAIGSDYDGWLPAIPSDMRDCRDVTRLGEILRERGWHDDALDDLYYGNALRLLSRAA